MKFGDIIMANLTRSYRPYQLCFYSESIIIMADLDNLINIQPDIQDIEERSMSNKTSVAKVVLLFYLISVGGYTKNLMGKQLRRFIEDSRIMQHFIAFITLYVLISFESDFSGGPALTVLNTLTYAIIGYTWFIFTTKLDIHWNIMLLILLIGSYLIDRSMRVQETEALSDPNLNEAQKLEIKKTNDAYRTYMVCSLIMLTIVGTVLYSHKKSEQYGGGYDLFTYMMY